MTARRAAESHELTGQAEDYLKAIYELSRGESAAADTPVGTNTIAARLGIAAASVSGMLQRLSRLGLVRLERYRGTRLSSAGRAVALQLIRRHRIIETYLVSRLGYAWDDVHDEAERLEHAASDELIGRMAEVLGNPTSDPHGAPIPTARGDVDERRFASLATLPVGASARVARMSDRDPELLRYLATRGIKPGVMLHVAAREAFDGPLTLGIGSATHTVSHAAADRVWIEPAGARASRARGTRRH